MPKREQNPRLHLDMPFDEALERLVGVEPAELQANLDIEKGRKSPATVAHETGDPAVRQLSRKRKPKDVKRLLAGK